MKTAAFLDKYHCHRNYSHAKIFTMWGEKYGGWIVLACIAAAIMAVSCTKNEKIDMELPTATPALSPTPPVTQKTKIGYPTDTQLPISTHTPIPTLVPTPFSIVWLSDTQSISYHNYCHALEKMGRWISDESEERNILYVVQTGDAVENGFSDWQWEKFDQCYNEFKQDVPFLAIAGNHEIGIRQHDYAGYLKRDYVIDIPEKNSFQQGRAVYSTFRSGSVDFLILGAGWEAEEDATKWMNQVLHTHPDHVAILLFHSYINSGGEFSVIGKQMFEQVVKPNPNVRLVLCGHVLGTGVRFDDIDDDGDGEPDRRVTGMMYNYQHMEEECGQLRLLTFDSLSHSLDVMTYSPFKDRFYVDGYFHKSTFTIDGAF